MTIFMGNEYNEHDEKNIYRKERIAKMHQEKLKQELMRQRIRQYAPIALAGIALVIVIVFGVNMVKAFLSGKQSDKEINKELSLEENIKENVSDEVTQSEENQDIQQETQAQTETGPMQEVNAPAVNKKYYSAQATAQTVSPGDEVISENAIFIDCATGNILSQRGYKEVINPASMTKILTVLVAAENVTDLDDKFTITIDITDYSYVNDCSNVGFSVGEEVTIRDLFYGTILPSGADAAVALATYVAGSHEAFVDMMNAKAEELEISDTAHFTNCVGLYDKEHHCTVYDMAMILEAAVDNELCREVLSAHTYTTSKTNEHPEGITISNWFLRRIEDKDTGGEVICAKTGFVAQSRNCAASFGKDAAGNEYICVTAGSTSSWRCIYDHVELYKKFAKD